MKIEEYELNSFLDDFVKIDFWQQYADFIKENARVPDSFLDLKLCYSGGTLALDIDKKAFFKKINNILGAMKKENTIVEIVTFTFMFGRIQQWNDVHQFSKGTYSTINLFYPKVETKQVVRHNAARTEVGIQMSKCTGGNPMTKSFLDVVTLDEFRDKRLWQERKATQKSLLKIEVENAKL